MTLQDIITKGELTIEQLTDFLHQEFSHYLAWYQGADPLTQYTVLYFSGVCLLLLSFIVIFSRITK